MHVTQKHMKNESSLSDIGFKNRVIDILSRFDQFDSKIWRQGGRIITVNFRTANYEGAEELGKLMTRALNGKIPGYKAELVGVDHVGSKWFADIKFKKEDEEMTIEEAKDILSNSGKKAINESYLEDADVEELYEFAMRTLAFADQVHCWHWCCQSGFQHTHFEAIYDALRDFADELVEVCLGSGKNIRYSIQSEMRADSMNFEMEEAVEELEDFIEELQSTAENFDDYSEITTVLDDITKTLRKELGLIKSFA